MLGIKIDMQDPRDRDRSLPCDVLQGGRLKEKTKQR